MDAGEEETEDKKGEKGKTGSDEEARHPSQSRTVASGDSSRS